MMIYYGLKAISPEYLYVTAFIPYCYCFHLYWNLLGVSRTVGVAFMGVAIGLDANLAATAGAVVAGAYLEINCHHYLIQPILHPQLLA